ncbi:MAG: hypothetical protein DHS20C17_26710 [Cyclobacteriaceae bacterium]|nr:MAG: hypothetical protein DHS20C17_26710 [Cyclobacteriaceae bacterium]
MKAFQNQLDEARIIEAIGEVELSATAEVRVHIEKKCPIDVMDRAVQVFANLNMHRTRYRNGALLYIAYQDHKFAIIGDSGINAKVGPEFWQKERQLLAEYFKKEEFTEGICNCIRNIGKELARYFAYEEGDINELPDDISYGDQ